MQLSRDLGAYFSKCVKGFHRFNTNPIKEALWEDINAQVLKAGGYTIETASQGSHQPGADLRGSAGSFSNKSTKYDAGGRSVKISSYRLTNVCSDKHPGDISAILAEIQRRKNFTHYSILVRKETPKDIHYDWFLVPADVAALNPESYEWTQKTNKKGEVVGWKTNTVGGSSMSITFSMSSQLWMHVALDESFQTYRVGSCEVSKETPVYNYIELYDLFSSGLSLSGSGSGDAGDASSVGKAGDASKASGKASKAGEDSAAKRE